MKKQTYHSPQIKVVQFKVEMGQTASLQSTTQGEGDLPINRAGKNRWDRDNSYSTMSSDNGADGGWFSN